VVASVVLRLEPVCAPAQARARPRDCSGTCPPVCLAALAQTWVVLARLCACPCLLAPARPPQHLPAWLCACPCLLARPSTRLIVLAQRLPARPGTCPPA